MGLRWITAVVLAAAGFALAATAHAQDAGSAYAGPDADAANAGTPGDEPQPPEGPEEQPPTPPTSPPGPASDAPPEVEEPALQGGGEPLGQPQDVVADDAPEADAELQGKRIGRVDFNCDLPTCENPLSLEAFVDIMGLYVGQEYTTKALRLAELRLAKTGFFDKLTVEKRLVGDAVAISVFGEGATLVRRVRFEGVDAPPFESDLRKLLSYRRGQAFKNDRTKATAQLESLEALYEEEGYFGTRIAMISKEVEGRPHEVDLLFRVEKGERREICDVGIRGVRALTYGEARDELLSDFSYIPRRINVFPLFYTATGFKAGQQALIEEYRRLGHFQARITQKGVRVEQETGCVILAVDVFEGPRWDVRFSGNELFTASDLREQLPFFESGYVDSEEIRRAERAIEQLYETRGHPFAEVRGEEVRRDRLDRAIEFTIQEGPQLEIAEIDFRGNEHISAEVLREVLQTRPYGLFETGGYLQTEQLLGDFGRIEELYRQRGYLRALVTRFAVEVVDDDALRISILIEEGEPTLIERVEVDGNRILTDQILLRGLNQGAGKPFVPLQLKGDLPRLLQKYSQLGYPMTKIKTQCRLLSGQVVACEAPRMPRGCVARNPDELADSCGWEADGVRYVCERAKKEERCSFSEGVSADRIAIRHEVSEGPRVSIGNILLKGNFDTSSSVIYREIPFGQGDLLDTQRVIESQGNLRSLNLFDSVSVETIGLDEGVRDADETVTSLLISVEESRTRDIDLAVGVELRDVLSDQRQFLVTGEAEYNDRNLLGRGFGIKPRIISAVDTLDVQRVVAGAAAAEDQIGTEIRTIDYVVGAELIFSHPRFLKANFGIDKLFATLSPFYIIDLVGVINRQVLREEGGVRIELRKELYEILKRLFLKFGVEVKSIASFAPGGPVVDGERLFSPRRTVGKITPDLALDRRNSPLNPTAGYIARIEPALVSGDAFGRGRERFISDSFLRLTLSFSYYLPLWKDFVLGQSIRAGQIFPLAGRDTPIQADELYFLGGVSSVRGFPDGNLGPLSANQRPSGGEFMLNYNAELRYPLLPEYDIFGATFFDAGLLADCRSDEIVGRGCYEDAFGGGRIEGIRTAAGVGLRAVFFDQIPVVLDYGIVLNRVPGEKFGQVHFNVGYTFD